MGDILPDLLAPGLRLVFCGMAAGPHSARVGAYYARPGNRFWPALAEAGFTPQRLRPEAFPDLLRHGIGLTDLAKGQWGVDRVVRVTQADRDRLHATIRATRPQALAFTSGRTAALALGLRRVAFGRLAEALRPPGFPPVFVLPSTSGSNNGNWVRNGYQQVWTDTAMALGFAHRAAS
ncbi:mismatch-specific DNA-glycosylase [Falsiroseomonas selenitidurans]|uniref:Mismatch-specific DNA-glycosylase n=1 Tax=Falsiroseomonas selenitidurans TaxID=2716335 RepID=A0ABX1EDF3_9PROT|nr:mismatch-specific DNA-glycosylase [Falsiroseomonas selenitidurans]NKC33927.1 mismatch-specific DNA-glycosylase [Falsiroseomonas selenitidurans]